MAADPAVSDTERSPAPIGASAPPADDNLATRIAPHLPYLRRFARALCGSQEAGDGVVAATLEALIADRDAMAHDLPVRVALYRLFLALWSAGATEDRARPDARSDAVARQYLLLTTIEEFSAADAAAVLQVDLEAAGGLEAAARAALDAHQGATIMIIEDEPIIALDLESIVTGMGHRVSGIADTRTSAVALAGEIRPDVILADIQLADGSSGIDAVADILEGAEIPVIFITAFPERLLTGERPEPTFLITKPFRPETVEAAVAQVLFHNPKQ